MKIRIEIILVALLMVAIHTSVNAVEIKSMACKGGVVTIGDTIAEVENKCGQPNDISHNERSYAAIDWKHNRKRTNVTIKIDNWTFNSVENKLLYQVTFENGKVARLTSLAHGK